ncbi:type II toxin-antitoxin system Phd/YefM family antitoxin [Rhizobium mongolense]|uniref:Antitoxin n=2 Tax=Rhizobium mongolense TaxID=57676 RepID=A0ABR6IFH6_9HYPH|nr:type II toxin-antitoxin system Phd/YefM family antitoxin [Rhizobium mongolense]MBB4226555.1 prevent-host-death family protein [Rhizobium mongolense]TVZ73818.1 prevent-host-death family protein [Rhizobium mongolense USDA 1844]
MSVTTISSREFQQNANQAQKATRQGPVFITNRGRTAQVLLSIEDYHRLTGKRQNIADLLAMSELADIELEIPSRLERAAPVNLD